MNDKKRYGEILPCRAGHAGATTEPQAQPPERLPLPYCPHCQFCVGCGMLPPHHQDCPLVHTLKKRARQIIDAVFASPVVVETRCFSQPQEVDRLEDQIAAMLSATPRAEGLTVEAAWQPIETAPHTEEWRVVGKISDDQLLWWYRAMYWRGGWHTSRSYDTRIKPSHYLPLPEHLGQVPRREGRR
jgi:hypothetical protein